MPCSIELKKPYLLRLPALWFCAQQDGQSERLACKVLIDYWKVLQELWEECLESKLEREIRPKIIEVNHQMKTFEYYFGVKLGSLLLKQRHPVKSVTKKQTFSCRKPKCCIFDSKNIRENANR